MATQCGWRVRATDNDLHALAFARYTANPNDTEVGDFAVLDWHEPPTGARYALILGADLLYQLVDHGPILCCIDGLLADDGAAFPADPSRRVSAMAYPSSPRRLDLPSSCSPRTARWTTVEAPADVSFD